MTETTTGRLREATASAAVRRCPGPVPVQRAEREGRR